jgi:hypothetical protein
MLQPLMDFLRADASRLNLDSQSSYLRSYPAFLRYFQELAVIEQHHLIIAANFTYGWMPTILHFKSTSFDEAVVILNRAKTGEQLTDADVSCLIRLINNSTVGVSKLLHWINPAQYAIWDRHVARYLRRTCQWSGNYLAYLALCRSLINQVQFEPIHATVNTQVGYAVPALRAIELVMYATEVSTHGAASE